MKYSWQFICPNNPLFVQGIYFTAISFAGYAVLKVLKPQEKPHALEDLDLLFTSVSASTVSSMGTVEMEDFSSTQLWVLTILMLIGSEVFTSMLGLHFMKAKFDTKGNQGTKVISLEDKDHVESKTIETLRYALMVYLLVTSLGSSLAIYIYLRLVPDAQEVLKRKGIGYVIFSVFTAISSVGNCGFTPVNENMILSGNTLFAPCLRFMMWSLKKITGKEEYHFILQHPEAVGYKHLMNSKECAYLMATVISFIITETILFCSLEWNSEALQEMNSYQQIVGALFQSVNARHAGESIVDLSSLSSSILVLYTTMMYLPGYTSFLPKDDEQHSNVGMKDKRRNHFAFPFSALSLPVARTFSAWWIGAQMARKRRRGFEDMNDSDADGTESMSSIQESLSDPDDYIVHSSNGQFTNQMIPLLVMIVNSIGSLQGNLARCKSSKSKDSGTLGGCLYYLAVMYLDYADLVIVKFLISLHLLNSNLPSSLVDHEFWEKIDSVSRCVLSNVLKNKICKALEDSFNCGMNVNLDLNAISNLPQNLHNTFVKLMQHASSIDSSSKKLVLEILKIITEYDDTVDNSSTPVNNSHLDSGNEMSNCDVPNDNDNLSSFDGQTSSQKGPLKSSDHFPSNPKISASSKFDSTKLSTDHVDKVLQKLIKTTPDNSPCTPLSKSKEFVFPPSGYPKGCDPKALMRKYKDGYVPDSLSPRTRSARKLPISEKSTSDSEFGSPLLTQRSQLSPSRVTSNLSMKRKSVTANNHVRFDSSIDHAKKSFSPEVQVLGQKSFISKCP
ncbi:putative cation transporter HKT6 [Panicum miliaceum]|uniref:Cation transporter HKT6 n=1 Tax=Panicum miliaceum TaxID=4540 RepID=A0A3L6RSR5_PANMI|nr:putative cation transporter HKT6 [Panicum miliaceum]